MFLKKLCPDAYKRGLAAHSVGGLIWKIILTFLGFIIFAIILGVLMFLCGFIPVVGWILDILFGIWIILSFVYHILEIVTTILTYCKVIK